MSHLFMLNYPLAMLYICNRLMDEKPAVMRKSWMFWIVLITFQVNFAGYIIV